MTTIQVSNTEVTVVVTDSGVDLTVQQGQPGVGMPAGGATGQVVAKASNADYDFVFVDQGGGGGGEFTARNNTGVIIPKGAAVRITGAIGQNPTIAPARADSYATAEAVGVTKTDIANNSTGTVVEIGEVQNLDLSAFSNGQTVYLSATTAGALTTTEPTKPNWQVQVGYILHAHPTQGKLLVFIRVETTKTEYISDMTAVGEAVATASDQAAGRTALALGTSATRNAPSSGDAAALEVVLGSDTRLTNARTPVAHSATHSTFGTDPISPNDIGAADTLHSHGQISPIGTIGSTANRPLITRTGGEITTGQFGTTSNTFCQGNDSRLADARTPLLHASTHAAAGSDPISPTSIGAADAVHTHPISQVVGLQTALDGKVDDSQFSVFGFDLVDSADDAAARTTLGLGAVDTNANAIFYPVFVTAAGATVPHVDVTTTPLSYNPSTGQMSMRNLRVGLGASTYIDFSGPTAGFTCVSSTDQFAVLPNSFQHSGSNRLTVYSDNAVDFYSDTDDITFQTPTIGKKARFWSSNIARHVGVWHDAADGFIESTLGDLNLSAAGDVRANGDLIQKRITSGTASPTGGVDGDIYLQYV